MTDTKAFPAKFSLGRVVMTRGYLELFDSEDDAVETASRLIRRHVCGDFGDLCREDRKVNEQGLSEKYPGRIMSVYTLIPSDETIWIITEHDRSVTTVLLPSDY